MIEQNKKNISANFNIIKSWVQKHLKEKNSLLSCNNKERKVTIYTLSGNKTVNIPIKQSNNDMAWAAAWVNVYNICLNALEEKVQFLCLNDPLVTHVSGSKIRVGSKMIILPPEANEITYINALESIINIYEETKAREKQELKKNIKKPIVVNYSSIKIDKPSNHVQEQVKKEEIKEEVPKEIKKDETVPKRKIIGQKVSDNDLLKPIDCSYFRENNDPFVLITCTDLNKGEHIFVQNADLCKNENIPIGAFISGKAVNMDQASHEIKKMDRLLADYNLVGPVVYEINNDYIRDNVNNQGKIIIALDIINDIAKKLNAMKFKPIICVDVDTHNIISKVNQEIRPNYKVEYPFILRILPREKDEVDESISTILMDPIFDYDIVTINTK